MKNNNSVSPKYLLVAMKNNNIYKQIMLLLFIIAFYAHSTPQIQAVYVYSYTLMYKDAHNPALALNRRAGEPAAIRRTEVLTLWGRQNSFSNPIALRIEC